MPDNNSANSLINIAQRRALISALPIFTMLTPQECDELAALMREINFPPGANLVTEGALIDSVLIIANGRAEATQEQTTKSKIIHKTKVTKVILGSLNNGDAIGLNDTGFFSATGKRTATVTALTSLQALVLDLKDLHAFFSAHPALQTAMYAAAAQLLKVKLIKQSLPFARLSHERLQELAKQVEEIKVPAGADIFKQGEKGDRCYLICSGAVDIIAKNEAGVETSLVVLKSPTLFGEATLITHAPRNATARAIENCELLSLKHEYLSELMETESNVADMFMTLMIDRSRPLQNPRIAAHHRTTADEQPIVILKNPDNGNYFKLSAEGWFIWQQLNGKQTMQKITLALAKKFDIFAPDVVAGLISKLAKNGFVTNVEVNPDDHLSSKPLWVRACVRMKKILEARIAIGDANKGLTTFYNKFGYLLFTSVGKVLLMTLMIAGFVGFCFSTGHVIELFKTIPNSWLLAVLLIPFTIFTVALHELGHALTTKSFGYEVHYMGVGWYWMAPVAFTDTSDMWLSGKRWPRIMVNLAGIITDCIIAGVFALLIFVIPNAYVQCFLWLFALYTYISAFRMLSPLQELDGYYVLMDLLDSPHLRETAVKWLTKEFPREIRHPAQLKNHLPEIGYWLACIVFLVLVSLLTYFVQAFVFKILGLQVNALVSLALPFAVVIFSSLGILADLRSRSD